MDSTIKCRIRVNKNKPSSFVFILFWHESPVILSFCRSGFFQIGYLPSLAIDVPSDDSPFEGTDDTGAQMGETMEGGMISALPMLTSAVPLTSETSVLASILEEKSWFNVGLFYSGYGSGPSRRVAFLNSAGNVGACVSFERDIPYGLTQEAADDIVSELFNSGGDIRVLVWMVSPEEIRLLLRSIRLRGNRFNNVGTSAWKTAIDNGLLDDGLLQEANGTIFIDDVNCDVNRDFRTYISEVDFDVSLIYIFSCSFSQVYSDNMSSLLNG